MIVIGSATISVDQSQVTIDSPGGFGAFRGVRLTNYTANVLVLTNISSSDQGQSQELLLPLQQMVYNTDNMRAVPTVSVFGLEGSLQVAPAVLVEWATEPLLDFKGTYPVTIGVPSAAPYACVSQKNLSQSGGDISELVANPFRKTVTLINHTVETAPGNGDIYWSSTFITTGDLTVYPRIPPGGVRTVDSTAALFFLPGNAGGGAFLEIIEESWGACSLFLTIGTG